MRAVAWAAVLLAAGMSGCLGPDLEGATAPPFRLATNEGEVVEPETYRGKFLVLDLMATWCGPCRLEVAHLQEVRRVHGDKVAILSVGADPTETMDDLAAFAARYGADWPHALDVGGVVGEAYGLRIIPKLIVIDPEGRVVLAREGEVLPAAIHQAIDPATAPTWTARDVAAPFLALAAGVFSVLNPYDRLHREPGRREARLVAILVFLVLGMLAWPFAALASTRATYGSLAVGAVALLAVPWWFRARRKEPVERPPHLGFATGDRLYEGAPHFGLALVLALTGTGTLGFFAPVAAFAVGATLGILVRERSDPARRTLGGLIGLAFVGVGLLAFGGRILVGG